MANYNIQPMKDLQGYFKPGQRKKIYNSCKSYRDRVLIMLLWKTGRRISEILLLKVKDIDFENKSILWNILKKKHPLKRWKPVDDFTLRLLAEYINKTKNFERDDYLLHGGDPTKHISRQRAFQIIRGLGRSAGVEYVGGKKIHPHHFRHSFAIDMARDSTTAADLVQIKIMLEHVNTSVTEQYLQFANKDLRKFVNSKHDN